MASSSSSESNEIPFKSYIDEPPIDTSQLRDHLINTRERAWKKFNYACLGRRNFLEFSIQRSPIYSEIIDNCENRGATIIDFGCCLGQDVRQLVYDGVPFEQIRNYELFRDEEKMKEKKIFISGDIFDDEFLKTIEPADYLYAGSFIHLFDDETQKEICLQLSHLCKRTIIGRQMGILIAKKRIGPL